MPDLTVHGAYLENSLVVVIVFFFPELRKRKGKNEAGEDNPKRKEVDKIVMYSFSKLNK